MRKSEIPKKRERPAKELSISAPRWLRKGWAVFLALLLTVGGGHIAVAQTPITSVGVYYVGAEDGVAEAINLAAPYIVRVDQPELAQVLVLNDLYPRQEETLRLLLGSVRQGDVGLVIFCGSHFPRTVEDLRAVFGIGAFGITTVERSLAVQMGNEADPLHQAISWDSAPPLQARVVISNPNLLLPIVTTIAREPVIQRVRGREKTQVFIVGAWFGASANHEWQSWPYFRYLVYRLVAEAAGATRVLSFADYPFSPVPHGQVRSAIIGGGLAALLIAVVALYLLRRRLFMQPSLRRKLWGTSAAPPSSGGWESVGFHRPLAGLLTLLGPYFPVLALLTAYQLDFLPRALVPWPLTLRLWNITALGLSVLWLLFDLEIGVAAVYYFATLRVHHPREAFRYFQFYVWWQLLGGAVQLAAAFFIATFVLPNAATAYLAYYVIAHALIQFPGFYHGFQLFFRALQRLDYEQYLSILAMLCPITFQSAAVVLLRRWNTMSLGIDETVRSVLGLGIGLYLTEMVEFGVGWLLYQRLGYRPQAFFLPTFGREVIKRMLSFGGRLTFGAIFVPLGVLAQVFLLPRFIPTFDSQSTPWLLALALVTAYEVLGKSLYRGLLPAMAEAHSQGYRTLLRYYSSQGIHYGIWFSLFLFATLCAVGDRLVRGWAGAAFADVTAWLVPLLIWGALQWGAWFSDAALTAIGHPALASGLTIGEQVLRLGLMGVLVLERGMAGLPAAYAIALMLRLGVAWLILYRQIGRLPLYKWRTLVVPALAAWLIYSVLHGVAEWWPNPTASVGLVLGCIVLGPALALYGFLTALFGGWDNGSLAELQRAVPLSGIGFPLAWLLTLGIGLGCRLSPLHGRFPVTLRALAEEEAKALTLGRVTVE